MVLEATCRRDCSFDGLYVFNTCDYSSVFVGGNSFAGEDGCIRLIAVRCQIGAGLLLGFSIFGGVDGVGQQLAGFISLCSGIFQPDFGVGTQGQQLFLGTLPWQHLVVFRKRG